MEMTASKTEELTSLQEALKEFMSHVDCKDNIKGVAEELSKLHSKVIGSALGLQKALKVRDGYLVPLNNKKDKWCKLLGDNKQFHGIAVYTQHKVKRVMLDTKLNRYVVQESSTIVTNGTDADIVSTKLAKFLG